MKCLACDISDHQTKSCPKMHYMVDRDNLIKNSISKKREKKL
jgi:hypothetical protein